MKELTYRVDIRGRYRSSTRRVRKNGQFVRCRIWWGCGISTLRTVLAATVFPHQPLIALGGSARDLRRCSRHAARYAIRQREHFGKSLEMSKTHPCSPAPDQRMDSACSDIHDSVGSSSMRISDRAESQRGHDLMRVTQRTTRRRRCLASYRSRSTTAASGVSSA